LIAAIPVIDRDGRRRRAHMHAAELRSEREVRPKDRTGGAGAAAAVPPGAVTQAPADRRDPSQRYSERASGQQRTFMLLHDLLQNIARRFNLQRKKERACSGRPRESRGATIVLRFARSRPRVALMDNAVQRRFLMSITRRTTGRAPLIPARKYVRRPPKRQPNCVRRETAARG